MMVAKRQVHQYLTGKHGGHFDIISCVLLTYDLI